MTILFSAPTLKEQLSKDCSGLICWQIVLRLTPSPPFNQWDAIQLRLGAKAASGGGLKASSFKPVVYKATPHLFVSLESLRECRRAREFSVQSVQLQPGD